MAERAGLGRLLATPVRTVLRDHWIGRGSFRRDNLPCRAPPPTGCHSGRS